MKKTNIFANDPVLRGYLTGDSTQPLTLTSAQAIEQHITSDDLRALALDVWILGDDHGDDLIEDLIDLDFRYHPEEPYHYKPTDVVLTIDPRIRDYARAK